MTTNRSQLNQSHLDDSGANDNYSENCEHSDEEGGIHIDDIYIPPAPKPVCSTADVGPRLIITKIVNKWFKSYAGEQIVGPFHKRFNSIIGPNGSGKSNVIDSMLFVFGYRANKIRCKKVSTLLHNSDKYKNVQSCIVSVHFAKITDMEGEGFNIIPNSEFVVSRTANKDNSSHYELNGKRVQFKEIASLLRSHGIDLDHNRFLILQGEVEQIAMMKPKGANEHDTGMLEYLEDIIGTSRYKEPLEKLFDKVELLNGRRSEKLNRLKLIETDMNELRGPMEEAVEYLKLENSIILNKNILYQKKIFEIEYKKDNKDKEKETILSEQQNFIDQLKQYTEDKSNKESAYNTTLKAYEVLQKKKDSLKQAFENANAKDFELQTEMQRKNMSRKKCKQQIVNEKKKLNELENLPEKTKRDLEQLHNKEKQLNTQLQKLQEDQEKLRVTLNDDMQALRDRREVLTPKLDDVKLIASKAESAYQLAESKLTNSKKGEDEEIRKFQTLTDAYEMAKKTSVEYANTVKVLKTKIPLTEKSLQDAIKQLNSVHSIQRNLEDDKRQKWSNLESSKSSMQASKSKGRVLGSLMQAKLEGKCPGLFGRLGDLGAIDKKYDIAISTACGPLDNIVVDTVDTAQWCIEFLKTHNLGRATFIALDRQERLREAANTKIKTPENVFRLYDLIQVNDERVKTAFYYGLRDTLVANDLEQASRVAYGQTRFRVVTLQGSLIEIMGVMSGGGNRVSRGRMGQSITASDVSPEDINRMEEELKNLEQNIRENSSQSALLERQINTLRPELEKMKMDLKKFTKDLESSKQDEPKLLQQLNEQKNKVKTTKSNPEEVKKLERIVEETKATFETASSNAAIYQREFDTITDEIDNRTADRMKPILKNIADVKKSLEKIKAEISRINVVVSNSERNLVKCQQKIATLEEDIQTAEKNLTAMHAQKEEVETDAKQLLKCTEELAMKLVEKEEELSSLKQELSEITKAEKKMKSTKIEVDGKLDAINKVIKEINAQLHEWRSKKNGLKLNKIPLTEIEELKTFTAEELKQKDLTLLNNELAAQEQIQKSARPNLEVIKDFEVKQRVYMERFKELEQITEQRNQMHNMYESLRNRRKNEFLDGYDIIRKKLKEMYQMITLGGDADFELVDNFDPFTEGVQFNVRPPKKSWKIISNLSGGEKTLSSLALVFALHYYKPSPLYVMDEIDAALDFKNVSIVGHYIKERTKNAQFIIISLRPNMFELADYLVGICKTHDCTNSVTVDLHSFEAGQDAEINENGLQEENGIHEDDSEEDEDVNELQQPDKNVSSNDNGIIDDSFECEMDVDA